MARLITLAAPVLVAAWRRASDCPFASDRSTRFRDHHVRQDRPGARRCLLLRFPSLWVATLLLSLASCQRASAPDPSPSPGEPTPNVPRITTLTDNGGRLDWSRDNVIAFDRAGADGYFDVFRMNADGSGEACLTCDKPGFPTRHQGNPAWHPSGDYIVFQAQKPSVTGPTLDRIANPGSGVNNDVWVMDRAGSRAWRLTDVPSDGGVLHPHFSHSGSRLLWSERVGAGGRYGEWVIRLADFRVESGEPRIDNVRTYQPGAQRLFYETHGFMPGDDQILFSGNLEAGLDELFIDIYRMDLQSGAVTNLTATPQEWDEHAHPSPAGGRIVWMSSRGLPPPVSILAVRTDFWMMNADGSNPRRLTSFNQPGSSEFIPGGAVAADTAWAPDGRRLAAYIVLDVARVIGRIVLLDFGAPQPLDPGGAEMRRGQAEPHTPTNAGGAVAPLVEAAPRSIAELRAWDDAVDRMHRDGALVRVHAERDELGRVVERLVQVHDGAVVRGGEVVRQLASGQTVGIISRLVRPSAHSTPAVSESEASAVFRDLQSFTPSADAAPQLVLWESATRARFLAYALHGWTGRDLGTMFLDAGTGFVAGWVSDVADSEIAAPLPMHLPGLLARGGMPPAVSSTGAQDRISVCVDAARLALAPARRSPALMTRVIVDLSPTPGQPGGVWYIGRQILLSGRQHDTAGDPRALPAHQIAHALLDHGGSGRREGEGALVDEVFARLLTPVIEQTCSGQPAQDLAQGRIVYRAARLMPAASSPGLARAAVSQARADLYGESPDLGRQVAEALTAAGLP